MLFMVSTLDFYPDVLIPPMMHGAYYSIFFIVYLLLFIFLFAPIPLAVVYEGFKKHRMEIAISDIIKQKTAMMASFIALDLEDFGYLSHQ
jgi:two pore calcium channel protein 1/two pore calcium channel protein 3